MNNIKEIMKQFEMLNTKHLIAPVPLKARDESRLLVIDRKNKSIYHRKFSDIIEYLTQGDCLVINKSKVIKAKLDVKSELGSNREILLISKEDETGLQWKCLSKKLTIGIKYYVNNNLYFIVLKKNLYEGYLIEFSSPLNFEVLDKIGKIPLPNYILKRRKDLGIVEENDSEAYQTIYATEKGSIAAPTAGFHFTKEIIKKLQEKGVIIVDIILHIGYGTFKMVRTEPDTFKMPPEYAIVSQESAKKINDAKVSGKKIFVVGTSSMRTLEKMNDGKYVIAGNGYVDIFIKPGWNFKIADCFITNLHLPHSPPLYMTLAFSKDPQLLLKAYSEAVSKKYRFYSYGDCSLII
ncbi:MAG: tRNA preQ1(34) S-adenosylmethionine ribosyltransferase-isomerase QueA [Elusimicrobiales bacterium]|nr:tRNA preQ1(34) S-adenosylmethionine ribosyltransferase-isomerase QueA [Elusimicrobiales bacterium]